MLLSPFTMRTLLLLCAVGMALLAALFLRRRGLPVAVYLSWGLFAIFLPLIGPFIVLWKRPGKRRKR